MRQLNRTRFLAELDNMLLRDKDGAIDDMLQVLSERGVVKQASFSQMVDERYRGREGFMDHMKAQAATSIGRFLNGEGVVKFEEEEETPFLSRLTGTAWFVARKRL